MKRSCCAALAFLALAGLCAPGHAWTPFERKTAYEEVALSPSEQQKVQQAAGWAKQSDTELLIELSLQLLPADQPASLIDLGTGCGAVKEIRGNGMEYEIRWNRELPETPTRVRL